MTDVNIGAGRFMMGDCLERMSELPDASVDMILCDLPYGTTQNKWDAVIPFEPLWKDYWRVAKPNAAVVLTAQCPFDKALGASQLHFLKYEWLWLKPNSTGLLNAKKQPLKNAENVLVFYKKQPTYNPQMRTGFKPYRAKRGRRSSNYGHVEPNHVTVSDGSRYPISTIEFNQDKGLHPTQKPVALFEYLIRTYTDEGMTVLDNCAGSGTTAIAAERAKRRWICIERDPEYYAAACNRVRTEIESRGLFA